jgi:hypothetical protein
VAIMPTNTHKAIPNNLACKFISIFSLTVRFCC